MLEGDTAPATADVPIEQGVMKAFAALRAETEAPVTEDPAVATEAPESAAPEPAVAEEPKAERARFKIGDEEVDEDTLLEWRNNGLRQKDYTQKRMADAAQAKKDREALALQQADYASKLKQAEAMLQALDPQEPDWVTLRTQVSAEEYLRLDGEWKSFQKLKAETTKRREEAEAALAPVNEAKAKAAAEANYARVMELIPDWTDEGKRTKDWAEMVAHVADLGASEQDLLGARPEFFKILRNSMLYEQLQQAKDKPKIVKVDGPTLKPGSSTEKPKTNALDSATRRVAQTNRDEDGVAAFRELRKAGLY